MDCIPEMPHEHLVCKGSTMTSINEGSIYMGYGDSKPQYVLCPQLDFAILHLADRDHGSAQD